MGRPAKLLEEKQLAAPAEAEGAYPAMAAGDWCVWFRRVFTVSAAPTVVSAVLGVSDAVMSPFARFAVVDNDGAGTVTHFVAGAAPAKTFAPNTHGTGGGLRSCSLPFQINASHVPPENLT